MRKVRDGQVAATIVWSKTGGALRTIINGRRNIATGIFVAIKGKHLPMPWESEDCELPILELAEFGSPIYSLMAQPHRLEIHRSDGMAPLVYFPDLMISADGGFVDSVTSETPFGRAVLEWDPTRTAGRPRALVIEVKSDNDRRLKEPDYDHKLKLAEQAYHRKGLGFLTIKRTRDIDCVDFRPIREILQHKRTVVRTADLNAAYACAGPSGSRTQAGRVVEALGGGDLGWAKLSALHVRRILSVDVTRGFLPSSPVAILDDGEAIWRAGR